MLKIASAQLNLTIGDIEGNIAKMSRAAMQSQCTGADIVVFPELSLTGYYPGDLLDDSDFQARLTTGTSQLLEATKATPGLYWVVGAPTNRLSAGVQRAVGKPFYNSLLVLRDGEIELTYAKQLLPTYGIFDEKRHFEPGPDVSRVLKVNSTRVGFLICEDGWNDEGTDYQVNPFERLADAQPDIIVSINASPSNVGKREQRQLVFSKACKRHGLPLLYVNHVGGHDQLVFDGGSFAMNAEGSVTFEACRFEEDLTVLKLGERDSGLELRQASVNGGGGHDLSTMEFYSRQIVLGVRDYMNRCGFRQAVVGCSGGIDSAVVLALAVKAVGADNVTAIGMPSRFSSEGSISDSVELCRNLGVRFIEHPISAMVNQFESGFSQAFGTPLQGLPLENLQARVRGTILMEYSNAFGHLLLTTGNKSEISVGYCTLYGDTNGGLGPIGDLYKTEVFELARHLNASSGCTLIPQAIIDKPPSAELAPGQRDTDSLPPYEVLDSILKVFIEGSLLPAWERAQAESAVLQLRRTGEGKALLVRIQQLIARNEYKRRQAPPIIRVRPRAFGSGRQVPIAAVHYANERLARP